MNTETPTFPRPAGESPIEDVPSPAYGETYGQIGFSQDGFNTEARVASKKKLGFRDRTMLMALRRRPGGY